MNFLSNWPSNQTKYKFWARFETIIQTSFLFKYVWNNILKILLPYKLETVASKHGFQIFIKVVVSRCGF